MLDQIVFIVSAPDPRPSEPSRTRHVITSAFGREGAKLNARSFLGQNPDNYTVTPLTAPGDGLKIDVEFG